MCGAMRRFLYLARYLKLIFGKEKLSTKRTYNKVSDGIIKETVLIHF